MDFCAFENTIDKNIETDKASDKFDQQLQAYKDAGNSLSSAKSGVEMATASMHEAKDKLSEASDKANGWVKTLLWIFLPCFLYTIFSVIYFVASYIDK